MITRELEVERCAACAVAVFPPRLACPACGAERWRREPADAGTVEEVTTVHRAVGGPDGASSIASVRADAGPMLVVAVAPGTPPGARVALGYEGDVLRAVLRAAPQPSEEG